MDFMRLFKSLEELLYEVMVMLVFFPRTLWLTVRYPQRMMDYADTELGDVQSEQYKDTLSPPLFLMMCLLISHLFERAEPAQATSLLPDFLNDTQNLLIFRVFIFSLFPLIMALRLLQKLRIGLDRDTLKPIFYSQCFVTAPIAMSFGISRSVSHASFDGATTLASVLFVLLIGWYLAQQTLWFRTKLQTSLARGFGNALVAAFVAQVLIVVAAVVVLLAGQSQ
ncbi:hypothetical protein [Blastomonas sp.]|uniref:hypothetical protein n=1 Tax=Blastomonas sp. TaxID=1909299 RepID=UPI00260325B1|nr:hypothetical protein [Blastomonas sp.]MDM7956073.1 hypothetical protein [Blastomonas sp.]